MRPNITLIVKPTNECNFRCKYCYHADTSYDMGIMSEEILEALIKKAQSEFRQVVYVWHGGEPLLCGPDFFRKAVMTSYNSTCCITGLNTKALLIASHIKPWKDSSDVEKTNPRNGLCLNALHDKAFDKGYLTISPDYFIHISEDISDIYDGEIVDRFFKYFNNKQISVPEKFAPEKDFLIYHNDVIYQNWR